MFHHCVTCWIIIFAWLQTFYTGKTVSILSVPGNTKNWLFGSIASFIPADMIAMLKQFSTQKLTKLYMENGDVVIVYHFWASSRFNMTYHDDVSIRRISLIISTRLTEAFFGHDCSRWIHQVAIPHRRNHKDPSHLGNQGTLVSFSPHEIHPWDEGYMILLICNKHL